MDLKDFELIYNENRVIISNKLEIESKLKEIVGQNNVSSKDVDLLAYSKDSTLITSAPKSPNICVARGPGRFIVRSSIRIPERIERRGIIINSRKKEKILV